MPSPRPLTLTLLYCLCTGCAGGPAPERAATPGMAPKRVEVPGSGYVLDLMPVPGDPATGSAPFWIGKHELVWDAFDAFLLKLDEKQAPPGPGADAISRPTKPYLPPDRGFGHEGYAAISLSFKCAQGFCEWLSAKTKKRFRLPTEAEWERAARAGATQAWFCGDDPQALDGFAWYAANAGGKPHPVGKKTPNAYGLCDVHGNVAEWCVAKDGTGVLRGGSFRQPAGQLRLDARLPDDPEWNRDDPNIPKGTWWLVNGDWIGFRVLCENP